MLSIASDKTAEEIAEEKARRRKEFQQKKVDAAFQKERITAWRAERQLKGQQAE